MAAKIEHVIVLMLENRSFDHMLGFLNHGNPKFPNLHKDQYSNRGPADRDVGVSANARYRLTVGPDHSHKGVKQQLAGGNAGFVANYYERLKDKVGDTSKRLRKLETGLKRDRRKLSHLSPARTAALRRKITRDEVKRRELKRLLRRISPERDAGKIMACFSADRVPVLSSLAQGFGVCVHWFASVPGQTWPNRAFAHAATSDGEVDITPRFYHNRTIFEDLSNALGSKSSHRQRPAWAIYHDGPPHTWVYPALYWMKGGGFRKLGDLVDQIANPNSSKDPLPRYCFVEPNHGLKVGPFYKRRSEHSNSQHPENNAEGIRDFVAGERLIADIYNALKANYGLFKKTLFLVTYDEHGGFFDHVQPGLPRYKTVAPDGKRGKSKFDFTTLGVRIPAVVISPKVKAGTVDTVVRDHASIPKTLRAVFIGNRKYLTKRERWAKSFLGILNLKRARAQASLPEVHPLSFEDACRLEGVRSSSMEKLEKVTLKESLVAKKDLDALQQSLVHLAANTERLLDIADLEGEGPASPKWSATAGNETDERTVSSRDLADHVENVSRRLRNRRRR